MRILSGYSDERSECYILVWKRKRYRGRQTENETVRGIPVWFACARVRSFVRPARFLRAGQVSVSASEPVPAFANDRYTRESSSGRRGVRARRRNAQISALASADRYRRLPPVAPRGRPGWLTLGAARLRGLRSASSKGRPSCLPILAGR